MFGVRNVFALRVEKSQAVGTVCQCVSKVIPIIIQARDQTEANERAGV